jgi:AcrR family transcriptional regulator
MTTERAQRKPRADALRNRALLADAAKQAFMDLGDAVTMEEIARRAGVGIGTLYRHFPSRDAVVEAVFWRAFEQLAEAAQRLQAELPPAEALHAWLKLFVDYMAAKRVIGPALHGMANVSDLYAAAQQPMRAALAQLVERAIAAGEIRADVSAEDLLRALIGMCYINDQPGWQQSVLRLLDVFVDGLRVSTMTAPKPATARKAAAARVKIPPTRPRRR